METSYKTEFVLQYESPSFKGKTKWEDYNYWEFNKYDNMDTLNKNIDKYLESIKERYPHHNFRVIKRVVQTITTETVKED